ncbi:MAG: hypothetical protein ABI675_19600 [Chitinophagaceae bacterium]
MPAYSYKERFVPMVLDLSKGHTIRKRRKKGFAKIGDTIYHYYGLRTKLCRKLGEAPCTDVRTIVITADGLMLLFKERISDEKFKLLSSKDISKIYLSIRKTKHTVLSLKNKNELAWRDGFRPEGSTADQPGNAFELMFRWWKLTHDFPFIGDIIYWDTTKFIHHKK